MKNSKLPPRTAIIRTGRCARKANASLEPFWLLDRTGTALTSTELATKLAAHADSGAARLNLAIAGAHGASDALRARADFVWSLSPLTFLHEWARAIVVEQLYRAAKINRNEPYHK